MNLSRHSCWMVSAIARDWKRASDATIFPRERISMGSSYAEILHQAQTRGSLRAEKTGALGCRECGQAGIWADVAALRRWTGRHGLGRQAGCRSAFRGEDDGTKAKTTVCVERTGCLPDPHSLATIA